MEFSSWEVFEEEEHERGSWLGKAPDLRGVKRVPPDVHDLNNQQPHHDQSLLACTTQAMNAAFVGGDLWNLQSHGSPTSSEFSTWWAMDAELLSNLTGSVELESVRFGEIRLSQLTHWEMLMAGEWTSPTLHEALMQGMKTYEWVKNQIFKAHEWPRITGSRLDPRSRNCCRLCTTLAIPSLVLSDYQFQHPTQDMEENMTK
jgi:hypothetical protein